MQLQLEQVLEEWVGDSSIPEEKNNFSKMKPICGHCSNKGYEPYVENDASEFCQHLKYFPYVHFGKSGWIESSSTSKTKNMGEKSNEVISISNYTPLV